MTTTRLKRGKNLHPLLRPKFRPRAPKRGDREGPFTLMATGAPAKEARTDGHDVLSCERWELLAFLNRAVERARDHSRLHGDFLGPGWEGLGFKGIRGYE